MLGHALFGSSYRLFGIYYVVVHLKEERKVNKGTSFDFATQNPYLVEWHSSLWSNVWPAKLIFQAVFKIIFLCWLERYSLFWISFSSPGSGIDCTCHLQELNIIGPSLDPNCPSIGSLGKWKYRGIASLWLRAVTYWLALWRWPALYSDITGSLEWVRFQALVSQISAYGWSHMCLVEIRNAFVHLNRSGLSLQPLNCLRYTLNFLTYYFFLQFRLPFFFETSALSTIGTEMSVSF